MSFTGSSQTRTSRLRPPTSVTEPTPEIIVEALGGYYIAPVFKYVAVFGLYLALVFLRPKGIFGW